MLKFLLIPICIFYLFLYVKFGSGFSDEQISFLKRICLTFTRENMDEFKDTFVDYVALKKAFPEKRELVREVLLEQPYLAQNFNSYFHGVVYPNSPSLSMNIFLKVVEYMRDVYQKYPSAQLIDISEEIKKCEDSTQLLLILDPNYHIINHTCWTAVAHKLYHSLHNLETYSIYENPFQIAFIPSYGLVQFFILVFVFFTLLVQFL